jgi:hypothetical protein
VPASACPSSLFAARELREYAVVRMPPANAAHPFSASTTQVVCQLAAEISALKT